VSTSAAPANTLGRSPILRRASRLYVRRPKLGDGALEFAQAVCIAFQEEDRTPVHSPPSSNAELKPRNEAVAHFLVDQRMPHVSSVEFLEQAIELYPEAKRALLTADADTDPAIRAVNRVQIDHPLMKPWDPPEKRLCGVADDLL
jgi:DNA-binding NtrC family response regulator